MSIRDRNPGQTQPQQAEPPVPTGPSISQLTQQAQAAYDKFVGDIGRHTTSATTAISTIDGYVTDAYNLISQITTSKTAAHTAKTEAETAKTAAQTAKTEAEEAKTAAQTAKAEAEEAKRQFITDTQLAQNMINDYKQQALTAKNLAESYSEDARISKDSAKVSATEAEQLNQNTRTSLVAAGLSGGGDVTSTIVQGFQNIIEGNTNMNELSELRTFAQEHSHAFRSNLGNARLLQASELLAQKDTVANNILMDYMYANVEGSTVNSVMDRISQLNNDKKRKLEINTYYNKAREQYINILKVIVVSCILIVPLVIANKNSMIPNTIFMFLTVLIIFLTIIFIFNALSDIYTRDNIDFDKLNVPYDREAALLEKNGTIVRKRNPLTSLTLTCIGQDCCDGSMVYDYTKNKCIATENFGGMFDNNSNVINKNITVYPIETESFINNCNFKNTLYQNSLSCSSDSNFVTSECLNTIRISE